MGSIDDTLASFNDGSSDPAEAYRRAGMRNPTLVTGADGKQSYVAGEAGSDYSAPIPGAAPVVGKTGPGSMQETLDNLRASIKAGPLPPPVGKTGKPLPEVSAMQAFGLGAADTVSFGFADELYGDTAAAVTGGGYSGGKPKGDIAADTKGVGGTSWRQFYTDQARDAMLAGEQQHPVATLGGQIVGSIGTAAVPFVPEIEGAGAGIRMLRSGADAAFSGGLYGVGSGVDAKDRLARGGVGFSVGAAAGLGGSGVMDAAGTVAAKGKSWAGGVYKAVKSGASPEDITNYAHDQIASAMAEDMRGGAKSAVWTKEELDAAHQAGIPLKAVDHGGEATRAILDNAVVQSPEITEAVKDFANERFKNQTKRAVGVVQRIVGGDVNAVTTQTSLEQASRAANAPAYKNLYAANNKELTSTALDQLANTKAVKAAMKLTESNGSTFAQADKTFAFNPTVKNLQFWDYTMRTLRDAARAEGEGSRLGGAMHAVAGQLRDELDRMVPGKGGFKEVRQGAGGFLGQENALEAGRAFASATGKNAEYKVDIAKMSDPDKQMFKTGFAHNLIAKIMEVPDNTDLTTRAFLSTPAARERINMAMGEQGAKELEVYIRAEQMANRVRDVLSNSKTMKRSVQIAQNAAGAGAGLGAAAGDAYMSGDLNSRDILGGAMAIGAAYGHHMYQNLSRSLAMRAGQMLLSDDAVIAARGVKMVAGNPQLLSALRAAGDAIKPVVRSVVDRGGTRAGVQAPVGKVMDAVGPEQGQKPLGD